MVLGDITSAEKMIGGNTISANRWICQQQSVVSWWICQQVSPSSAVIIFMKNTHLEQLLETCNLYSFKTESYDETVCKAEPLKLSGFHGGECPDCDVSYVDNILDEHTASIFRVKLSTVRMLSDGKEGSHFDPQPGPMEVATINCRSTRVRIPPVI
jgi:hypothetical protein